MKKTVLTFLASCVLFPAFSAELKVVGAVTAGIYPVEKTLDSKYEDSDIGFGGAYLLADFNLSSEYITAASKIYYRTSSAQKWSEEGQKIELKRAYVRFRPMGNNALEFSAGKLYSYYLPGNFFNLAEIYTGASRWGKTGIAVKSEIDAFTFGLAVPATESYVAYGDSFGVNGCIGYDLSKTGKGIPLSFGADCLFTRTEKEKEDSEYKCSWAFSSNWKPELDGTIRKLSLTMTVSGKTEPYVSSSVFKNVTNYKNEDMKESNLISLNFNSYVGDVQVELEAEAGKSVKGNMIPLYTGLQLLIPFTKIVAFKPRVYYYGALDSDVSDDSRQTFVIYPRLWITRGLWTYSLGFDWFYKQTSKDEYKAEWNVPIYVKYRIPK